MLFTLKKKKTFKKRKIMGLYFRDRPLFKINPRFLILLSII